MKTTKDPVSHLFVKTSVLDSHNIKDHPDLKNVDIHQVSPSSTTPC